MYGEAGFDWFAYALGAGSGLIAAWFLRRKSTRDLDQPPPLPPQVPPDVRAQVLKLRAQGQTIEAIKLVRERTGCELKAAKNYVDDLR